MTFDSIKSRLTGLSCPIFGASWNPPESDRSIARRVLTFLEDRRVLYSPSELEVPRHCVESVLDIRERLSSELQTIDNNHELAQSLRALRAACRKFLDEVGSTDGDVVRFGGHRNHWASWEFNGALGELRSVFGIHLLQLAARYGLDVEEPLAKILPCEDAEDVGYTFR